MSRVKKILIASGVLTVGFGLAWPFRKTANDNPAPPIDIVEVQTAATTGDKESLLTHEPERAQVQAQMASTGSTSSSSFDLENHPSIAGRPAKSDPVQRESPKTPDTLPPVESPVTSEVPSASDQSRPAYEVAPRSVPQTPAWPEEVVHVVQNGDTLEKLADRYLDDESRALELFDLNRDQLTNPHLLPIGAELRIPIPREDKID